MPQAISNQFKLDLAKLEQNALIELSVASYIAFMLVITKNHNLSSGRVRLISRSVLKRMDLSYRVMDQATDQH